ncbi:MAG: type II toxin-antitoxin system RelE/ParE family toxin [Lachnospiraceae bacterium]|nr:type II toxin-antitoxin system RelE/ParE family toxin [Lachnospiraceae bacterium]
MRVIWSDLAIEDLREIEEYIARDNPERAISFIMELLDYGDSLGIEGQTRKGTPAKWIDNSNVRELYYDKYTIVYEITDHTIEIHEIHNSAKLSRHFQEE